mgnify:CR=1 FL=1
MTRKRKTPGGKTKKSTFARQLNHIYNEVRKSSAIVHKGLPTELPKHKAVNRLASDISRRAAMLHGQKPSALRQIQKDVSSIKEKMK